MRARRHRDERGFALGVVIITAVIFSVAAFAILMMGITRARIGRLDQERARAYYAAEAGVVWAMQKLWVDPRFDSSPGWAGPPNDPAWMDTNADGINDTKVDIFLKACTAPPPGCESGRKLEAKVDYVVVP